MPYYELLPKLDEKSAILKAGPSLPARFTNWLDPRPWSISVPDPLDVIVGRSGQMLPFYNNPMPLMSKDMLALLREVGVDNLDDYRVEIRNPEDGEVNTNYRAVNIIGAIEAINESKSHGEELDVSRSGLAGKFYNFIVIDESKVHGQSVFRLAENLGTIVVSQAIKDKLLESYKSEDIIFDPLFITEDEVVDYDEPVEDFDYEDYESSNNDD